MSLDLQLQSLFNPDSTFELEELSAVAVVIFFKAFMDCVDHVATLG